MSYCLYLLLVSSLYNILHIIIYIYQYFIIILVLTHDFVQYTIMIWTSDTYWVSFQCHLCLFFISYNLWNFLGVLYNITIKICIHCCDCCYNHNFIMFFLFPILIFLCLDFTELICLSRNLPRFTHFTVNRCVLFECKCVRRLFNNMISLLSVVIFSPCLPVCTR